MVGEWMAIAVSGLESQVSGIRSDVLRCQISMRTDKEKLIRCSIGGGWLDALQNLRFAQGVIGSFGALVDSLHKFFFG